MIKTVSKLFSATALAMILAGSFLAVPAISIAQNNPPRPDIGDLRDNPQQPAPTPQPTQPTSVQSAAGQSVQVGADAVGSTFTEAQFIPLTNLPGFQNVSGTNSLPDFLNQLYRLCIGAAAVIAVLQIMRAGAMHMFNKGSLSQSQNVRKLIQDSLLGLLLVLSPAIVFGIINPDILDISLNFGAIKQDELERVNTGGAVPATLKDAIQQRCNLALSTEDSAKVDRIANTLEQRYATCVRGNSSGSGTLIDGVGNTVTNSTRCEATARSQALEFLGRELPNSAANYSCIADEMIKLIRPVTTQAPTISTNIANQIAQRCDISPTIVNSRTQCVVSRWSTEVYDPLMACLAASPSNLGCWTPLDPKADAILRDCIQDLTPVQRRCVIDKVKSGEINLTEMLRQGLRF